MNIAIIGGGAAGFFAAISCKEHHPQARVTILEKGGKLLTKVKVSGGGRCNVTHALFNNKLFSRNYPRGEKQLNKAFQQFNAQSTVNWFQQKNVKLVAEPDGRMFPESNDSQTIVDCLINTSKKLGVSVQTNTPVMAIEKQDSGFLLSFKEGKSATYDKVIVATGGSSKLAGFDWLEKMGHEIIPPVPSLFTFNMPLEDVKSLMGVVANPVSVKVQSTKLQSQGPLLITHWGFSGPAVLVLSSVGARELYEKKYHFNIQINFIDNSLEDALEILFQNKKENASQQIGKFAPFGLTRRFWQSTLEHLDVNIKSSWNEISDKKLRILSSELTQAKFQIQGKSTFKDEFVTAGGIELKEVNFKNMESKIIPGVYFAGEVLNIDAVTGGFNFQACWSESYIISEDMKKINQN